MTRSFDRRRYAREYARRKRAEKLARELATAARCPFRMGVTVCGGPLRMRTDGMGRTLMECDWCQRRKAGICRDCGQRVKGQVGRALRCALHKKLAHAASYDRYKARNIEALRAKAREYSRRTDVRERKIEYKRLYRAAFPGKVRREKARHAWHATKKGKRYHRRYAEKHGVIRPSPAGHPCVTGCGTMLHGRPKKCERCRQQETATARARLFGLLSSERVA